MYRGEIWWADLPDPMGSEPGYRRPVLIIQSDGFNQSAIKTVIVASLTSNIRLADSPGNVLVTKRLSGLPKDSAVNVSQMVTIDKSLLMERISSLDVSTQQEVDEGLRAILYL